MNFIFKLITSILMIPINIIFWIVGIFNEKGWVYVLSNPSFGKCLKIGMTNRKDYQIRIQELNSSTSLPTPFKVEFVYQCKNALKLEQLLHKHFKKNRVNKNREFFEVSVREVKKQIYKLDGTSSSRWVVKLVIKIVFIFAAIAGIAIYQTDSKNEFVEKIQNIIMKKNSEFISRESVAFYGITTESLELRSSPNLSADIIYQLAQSERLSELQTQNEWSEVTNGNISGWVLIQYIEKID